MSRNGFSEPTARIHFDLVGEALSTVAELRDDPVPRVRAAADRAVMRISAADA
jgi:hypothetical protein